MIDNEYRNIKECECGKKAMYKLKIPTPRFGIFEKKNFINAKLEKVVEGSSLRIKPKCNFCGNCGGCDYQHISVENGLELKRKIISKDKPSAKAINFSLSIGLWLV